MARKGNLKYQISENLKSKLAIGVSRHAEKIEQDLKFGQSTGKIHSWSTYHTYLKACLNYAEWLRENGVPGRCSLEETEKHAETYLKTRVEGGISAYTVKMERSALTMLYGSKISVELPKRGEIKRSRNDVESDAHFSRNGKYKQIFDLAEATGGRRQDLLDLRAGDFKEINGNLYVLFVNSKGGRSRLTPVRPDLADVVRSHLTGKKKDDILISRIDKNIDIHSYRRIYAKKLYECIKENRVLRDEILKNYPTRCESVKSENYKTKSGHTFNRDDLYVVTQALGHNRLEVAVSHYLT